MCPTDLYFNAKYFCFPSTTFLSFLRNSHPSKALFYSDFLTKPQMKTDDPNFLTGWLLPFLPNIEEGTEYIIAFYY